MTVTNKLAVLCVVGLLAGCAQEPVYLPSEINAHPKLYEGREVRIRGWVTLRVENRNIWDTKDDFEHLKDDFSHCVSLVGVQSWTGDKSIDGQVRTISGVFHQYEGDRTTELGMCNNSAIEVDTSKLPFRGR